MTMLRDVILLVCTVAAVCSAGQAAAETGRCSWSPPAIVVAQPVASEPEHDTSQSRDDIRRRREGRGASRSPEHSFSYYEASADTIYDAELQGRALPNGNLCLAVKVLTVRFGLKSRRILIARELATHPCMLDYVARHEPKHAAIDDELVANFITHLRTQLEQAWKEGLGVEARDETDGLAALKSRIDARIADLRAQFISERDAAQDSIDAKDFAPGTLPPACRHELRRLLGSGP
jgi:hypothetical protein